MKKRVLAVLLALTMVFSLGACGKSKSDSSNDSSSISSSTEVTTQATTQATTQGDKTEEIYNVDMQLITWGTTPTGLADVENAINEITKKEIGVTVTLEPISVFDLITESNLQLSSGEKLDLLCILPYGSGMDSIANYTNKNMLLPLDDLYDQYGQDIKAKLGDLVNIGYLGGKLYAIPPNGYLGSANSFVARTDILNELGFSYDENKIYTIDDLEKLFDAYKAKYGDGNYCVAGFSSANLYSALNEVDALGMDFSTGVLLDAGLGGNTKVENLFASDKYKEFVLKMRDWFNKGYFSPDAATITDGTTNLIAAGNYLGALGGTQPGGIPVMEANCGYDLTTIKLSDPYATTGSASLALWAIPATSENPEKTMQFLNLLYQDRELKDDIDSILAVGLEGKSYKIVNEVDGSKAIVDYADGLTAMTMPWRQPAPIFGDELSVPQYLPVTAEIYSENETYNQNIIDNNKVSCAFGYAFDSAETSAQVSAVKAVISQYSPILTFGSVDPEQVLPEFLKALTDAGIDDAIAANQKQLDTWLADKK